jgi:hypothetical protein
MPACSISSGPVPRSVAWQACGKTAELTAALTALVAHPLTDDSPSPIVNAVRRNRREVVEAVDNDCLDTHVDRDAIPHWCSLGARSLLILPCTPVARL